MTEKYTTLDRVAEIFLLSSFVFWLVSKTPIAYSSTLFGVFYEMTWLLFILFALGGTAYFLFKWGMSKFSFSKYYFYLFFIGLITLFLMRFVSKFELMS